MTGPERLALAIQRLPPERRWLHAQQSLIQAIGSGRDPVPGPRTRMANAIFTAVDAVGLAWPAIALVNVMLTLWLYLTQWATAARNSATAPLLVGIGAMREPELRRHLREIAGQSPVTVVETDLKTFFALRRLGLRRFLDELRQVWRETRPALAGAHADEGLGRRAAAVYLALHGHRHAYARAWFREQARAAPGMPVAFAAASHVAAAGVAAIPKAIHMPHGFVARTLSFPDFAEVYCSNRPEAAHFAARLPHARIHLLRLKAEPIEPVRLAAIAGVYGDHVDYDLSRGFIEWARGENLPVVVRRHPRDRSGYWDRWIGYTGVEMDSGHDEFAEFIRSRRPMLLVTWHSTTLFDALVHGVVPVTLSQDDAFADCFVFPFRETALRWPRERALIRAILDDPAARQALLRERREALLAPPGELQQPAAPVTLG